MSTTNDTSGALEAGRMHLRGGRFAEAVTAFQTAIKQDPNNDDAWQLLGGALSQQLDWATAVSAFRKAVALNPNEVRHYYNLALALHEGLGRSSDARLYLERGLELDPNHAPSRKLLTQLTPLTDALTYGPGGSQAQVNRTDKGPQALTTSRIAMGVGAAVGAGLLATALSYGVVALIGSGGVLTAIGTGWLVGLTTAKGCGQGGRVPAQIAMGVTVLFLLPTCLFLLARSGITAFSVFVYVLALYFGVQRAYITALTAR